MHRLMKWLLLMKNKKPQVFGLGLGLALLDMSDLPPRGNQDER